MSLILFVAPTLAIDKKAKSIIKQRNLDIDVIYSQDAKVIMDVAPFTETQIIIARGGMAKTLEAQGKHTIVHIGAAFHDVMQAIEELVQKGCRRIAVVMRSNIIHDVRRHFRLGDIYVEVIPCDSREEINATIERLAAEQSVDGIAGCNIAAAYASECGFRHTLIDSSREAISSAIDEAQLILKNKEQQTLRLQQVDAVIQNITEGVVVLSEEGEPVFSNRLSHKVFGENFAAWKDEVLPRLQGTNGEQILEVGKTKILCHRIPLLVNQRTQRQIVIFQEVEHIEKNARTVRSSLYQKGLYAKMHFSDIMTYADTMQRTIQLAERFARTDANVLILGETGTGKEGMAQSIHNASRRADKPFVSVNCASIPPNLMESEFFGYVDGAFTGARKSGKKGLFELAHQGTIFLDEIGELPLDIQGRLLRVLQEHEIRRIGDERILPLDIRIICATNRDLVKMVQEGTFREDLYYRINVLRLTLPPLRERHGDAIPLLDYYYRAFTDGRSWEKAVTPKARELLKRYDWPGNIRELRNVAEVLSCYDDMLVDESQMQAFLSGALRQEDTDKPDQESIVLPLKTTLPEAEREIIRQLLLRYSPEEVCAQLGISRVTLWRKAKPKE